MEIVVINELKKYYDVNKIIVKEEEAIKPNEHDIKLLSSCVKANNFFDAHAIIKKLSLNNWAYIKQIFKLPLFHIVYYTDKSNYYSQGVNVYAIDMMSAVEKFVSEFGIEPFYCTVKEK